uniref:Rhizobium loti nodulation genes, four coding regions with homology to nodA, nodb, nodC, and nodD genes n=1 Tax=Rhizobium loti TaxID=381 RepID=Q52840_RHILI|nr:homology with C-terminus of other Rhizobium nodB genes; no amino acid homology due to frame shift [Mesorhizobium loti]
MTADLLSARFPQIH